MKTWNIKESDAGRQKELSDGLGVSTIVAQLLINRGIATAEEAKTF